MAKDQLIPLNIVIGDRNYRIKVLPDDEQAVRGVVKTIHEKIVEFRTQFAGKDMQDYISMVLIWYATQLKEPGTGGLNEELMQSLLKMEKQLDEATAGFI